MSLDRPLDTLRRKANALVSVPAEIRGARGVYGALLLFLAGCAVGPDFVRPEPPAVVHYTQGTEPTATIAADGRVQRFVPGRAPVADWWRLFASPKLDAVMDEALVNNPNIQAAQASLRQSQDNLRAGYGVFYPQLDGGFGASRQKSSPVSIGSSAPGTIFNLFTLSATVSYALDVFGGERRAVEGLQAQMDVQRATLIGTYLTLSGNIVNTMIAQCRLRRADRSHWTDHRLTAGTGRDYRNTGTRGHGPVRERAQPAEPVGLFRGVAPPPETKPQPRRTPSCHPGRPRTRRMDAAAGGSLRPYASRRGCR